MSTDENKQVVMRFAEEWNRGNREGVYALFAQDYVDHTPWPGIPPGAEGLRRALGQLFDAFPDSQITIQLLVGEGDLLADHGYLSGTHQGSFLGIPPTGKKVKVAYLDIHRFKDGKIVEAWHLEDIFAALQQIGAIPSPQSARG